MNKEWVQRLSRIFILLGLLSLILFFILYFQRNNPKRLAFASDLTSGKVSSINSSQTPKELLYPDLGIHLPVIPSQINNLDWEVTDQGISYLTSSPLPGDLGNSILYGHNWSNLLGNLKKAKVGQLIQVKYDDDSVKVFKVEYISEVNPTQSSILDNSNDARITLYTCSGFFDSKRFVVVAKLQ